MTWETLIYIVVYFVTFCFTEFLWYKLDLDEKLLDLDVKLTIFAKRISSFVREHSPIVIKRNVRGRK